MRILLKKNGHQTRRVVTVPKRVTTVKRLRVRKKVETTISVKRKSYRKYFNENKLLMIGHFLAPSSFKVGNPNLVGLISAVLSSIY